MNRRHLLAALLGTAMATRLSPALGLETVTYSPDTHARLVESARPFLVDFFATWCSTCAAQERVLDQLTSENADYRAIPILRVDWDQHGNGELARSLAIPRRSTLVLMRGTAELGRLVAETRKDRIAGLLDLAAS
jgi:thioredoxin 1